uniref:Uncharacterized protein n=1 Tax=Romanomermis culicivorax TaxID=13658 RepID=A0A915HYZ9_ROMCU
MFIFETFTVTPKDQTMFFSLIDGEHTIMISFDGADDWDGVYTLNVDPNDPSEIVDSTRNTKKEEEETV